MAPSSELATVIFFKNLLRHNTRRTPKEFFTAFCKRVGASLVIQTNREKNTCSEMYVRVGHSSKIENKENEGSVCGQSTSTGPRKKRSALSILSHNAVETVTDDSTTLIVKHCAQDSRHRSSLRTNDDVPFEEWSRDLLVDRLREELSKRRTLESALDVVENAYNRQSGTLERIKASKVAEMRRRVDEANSEAERAAIPRRASVVASSPQKEIDNSDTLVSAETLLRMAEEKEALSEQYEKLKQEFTTLQQSRPDVPSRTPTRQLTNVRFPDLSIPSECATTPERHRALLQKWRELEVWCSATSCRRNVHRDAENESVRSKWNDAYSSPQDEG